MKKIDYFVTRFCIIFLIVFFITYALRLPARIYVKKTGNTNKFIQLIFFDRNDLSENTVKIGDSFNWTDFYPFEDEFMIDEKIEIEDRVYLTKNEQKNKTEQTKRILHCSLLNKIQKTENKIDSAESKFEKWLTENCIKKYFFFEKANYYEVFTKWNLTNDSYNATTNIGDGHFSGFCPEISVDELSKSIIRFSRFLKHEDIPFLYVQAPCKICKYDNRYSGTYDFANQNADAAIKNLSLNDVKILDLRDELHKENMDHYNLFFKTDHHWKPETGLWASKKIIENIDILFDYDISNYFIDEYTYTNYPKKLLGSYGKKITKAKTEPDDFTLIKPVKDFDINFEAFDKNNKIAENHGSFDAMLDFESIYSNDLYGKDPYHGYGYGSSNNIVDNLTVQNNYRILLIGDSFTNVVMPFMALCVNHLDRLDLRYFNGSLENYIKKNGPYDACLILYNPEQYNQTPGFVTHEELFDFR